VLGALSGGRPPEEAAPAEADRPAGRREDEAGEGAGTPAAGEEANPLALLALVAPMAAPAGAPAPKAPPISLETLVARALPAGAAVPPGQAGAGAPGVPAGGPETARGPDLMAGMAPVVAGLVPQPAGSEARTRVAVLQRETHFAPVLPSLLGGSQAAQHAATVGPTAGAAPALPGVAPLLPDAAALQASGGTPAPAGPVAAAAAASAVAALPGTSEAAPWTTLAGPALAGSPASGAAQQAPAAPAAALPAAPAATLAAPAALAAAASGPQPPPVPTPGEVVAPGRAPAPRIARTEAAEGQATAPTPMLRAEPVSASLGSARAAGPGPEPALPGLAEPGVAAVPPAAGVLPGPASAPAQQVAEAVLAELSRGPAAAGGLPGAPAGEGPLKLLTLQLHPADLGTVLVRMRLRDGQLEMSLHASREDSARLLREGGEVLNDLLRQGGYRPESVTVTVGSSSADGRGAQGNPGSQQGQGAQAFPGQGEAGANQGRPSPDQAGRRSSPEGDATAPDSHERMHESVSSSPERSGVYL
jgi:chemotaxis protein MotD